MLINKKKFIIKILFIFIILFNKNILSKKDAQELFTSVYLTGSWQNCETASGSGSTLKQTESIRKEIEKLIKNFEITSILDLPCGDFNWMKCIDLDNCYYIGADIVEPLIENNNKNFNKPNIIFKKLDALKDNLPKVDLIICRDLFIHYSQKDIIKILKNFKDSKSLYLLTTTFTNKNRKNKNIKMGNFFPVNLQAEPFNLPKPLLLINENCTEDNGAYGDKSLGLWKLEDIFLQN